MKIGVTQLCIPGPIDEVVGKTRDWGYDVLELNIKADDGVLHLGMSDAEKKAVAQKIADAGIELVSLVAGAVRPYSMLARDARERDNAVERCRQVLDTAAVMGANTILLVPGSLVPEVCYDEAMELVIDSLRKAAPHAERAGVHIGIEPVWNKFLVSPMDMKHVIEQVDSPFVGAYMDTGNMLFWNLPEHWIRILGAHIKKIHFKDFKRERMNIAFVQLRQGDVNWENVMREIRAANYDGPVISEVGGDEAQMAETARLMREIVAMAG
ncbi:MAG: sugar phosphate isomerase/epimerase [Kiritimatiellae bacterium]|nr:sugar phosphate isomerase/epimerase [Kiritimatiellia bacterium]